MSYWLWFMSFISFVCSRESHLSTGGGYASQCTPRCIVHARNECHEVSQATPRPNYCTCPCLLRTPTLPLTIDISIRLRFREVHKLTTLSLQEYRCRLSAHGVKPSKQRAHPWCQTTTVAWVFTWLNTWKVKQEHVFLVYPLICFISPTRSICCAVVNYCANRSL